MHERASCFLEIDANTVLHVLLAFLKHFPLFYCPIIYFMISLPVKRHVKTIFLNNKKIISEHQCVYATCSAVLLLLLLLLQMVTKVEQVEPYHTHLTNSSI